MAVIFDCTRTLDAHKEGVVTTTFGPKGDCLASGSVDKTIKIWNTKNWACLVTLKGHSKAVTSVAFSPKGDYVASGSDDNTVKIWDSKSWACLVTLKGHSKEVTSVAFSPKGDYLASGSDDKTVKIWDTKSWKLLKTLNGHRKAVTSVAFSPKGQHIASGSWDESAKIWGTEKWDCLRTFDRHNSSVHSLSFSHDGAHLASGSFDGVIKIWDPNTGELLKSFEAGGSRVFSVTFSAESGHLLAGLEDKATKIWDTQLWHCVGTLPGHEGSVLSVTLSPTDTSLVSGSWDNTIRVWEYRGNYELFRTLKVGRYAALGDVDQIALSPDGEHVAVALRDSRPTIWNATNGQHYYVEAYGYAAGPLNSLAFPGDGSSLIWGSVSGVIIFDISGKTRRVLLSHLSKPAPDPRQGHWDFGDVPTFWPGFWVTLSHDGTRAASVSMTRGGNLGNWTDPTVRVWDTSNYQILQQLGNDEGFSGGSPIAFSHDSKFLAWGNYSKCRIFNVSDGRCLHSLDVHGYVMDVAFSPDDTHVATTSSNTVKIWDATRGAHLATLKGHSDMITKVSFAPDGVHLATGSRDKTVKIWHYMTGGLLATLEEHTDEVMSVEFSNDGKYVMSGSRDATANFWLLHRGLK